MLPQTRPTEDTVDSKTYPLGENPEQVVQRNELALIALSHTPLEHRLYSAMLALRSETPANSFTTRRLMDLTGIRSLSTIRRGLEGLLVKLSIEKNGRHNGDGKRDQAHAYRVYSPNEVLARRRERGTLVRGYSQDPPAGNHPFSRAIARVTENLMLSRREAQVALCCVQGLTNAAIGKRLNISEQTVKFHLRHIFLKFGVKRRAELISKLLM